MQIEVERGAEKVPPQWSEDLHACCPVSLPGGADQDSTRSQGWRGETLRIDQQLAKTYDHAHATSHIHPPSPKGFWKSGSPQIVPDTSGPTRRALRPLGPLSKGRLSNWCSELPAGGRLAYSPLELLQKVAMTEFPFTMLSIILEFKPGVGFRTSSSAKLFFTNDANPNPTISTRSFLCISTTALRVA